MTIWADLNKHNIVINVIVADAEFIESLPNKSEFLILTRGGIGWFYDPIAKVFIAPQPYPSWTLDEFYDWQPPEPEPVAPPVTTWNEQLQKWVPCEL